MTFQQKVLYLLFLMFFGVGAAEVISIVLFPDPLGLFRDSEKLGYEMNPNFDGSHGKLTEFRTRITTNSKGLRDREYGGERSDKPLILTLGDSVTFGWGVELDETYPKEVERLFKGSVDVVNAGVWGYNTLQEIAYVKSGASGYRPDLVMVGFTSPITVQRNWYSAQVGRITVEPLYNPATGLAGRVRAVLKNNSNLFSFLERRWAYQGRILPSFLDFRRMGEAAGQEKTAEAAVADDIVPGTLPDEMPLDAALQHTKTLLRELRSACSQLGAPMFVVIFPNEFQLVEPGGGKRPSPDRQVSRNLALFLEQSDIPVLDLTAPLTAAAKHEPLFLHRDFTHINAEGHRRSAEAIHGYLSARLRAIVQPVRATSGG